MSADYQAQILITSKSFLPCNVIYLQAPGMRIWTSLGGSLHLPLPPKSPLLPSKRRIYCAQGQLSAPKNSFLYETKQWKSPPAPLWFLNLIFVLPGAQISHLWPEELSENLVLGPRVCWLPLQVLAHRLVWCHNYTMLQELTTSPPQKNPPSWWICLHHALPCLQHLVPTIARIIPRLPVCPL